MIEHFKKFDGDDKKNLLPLSFSQLSEFAFQRERWALKRLFGYQFPSSPAMERGKAVESGLHLWLTGVNFDEVVERMLAEYDGGGINVAAELLPLKNTQLKLGITHFENIIKFNTIKLSIFLT